MYKYSQYKFLVQIEVVILTKELFSSAEGSSKKLSWVVINLLNPGACLRQTC